MSTVNCQNCQWSGPIGATKPIQDIYQRVMPGEVMPYGECPECGALCHEKEEQPKSEEDKVFYINVNVQIDALTLKDAYGKLYHWMVQSEAFGFETTGVWGLFEENTRGTAEELAEAVTAFNAEDESGETK